jgi:peptidoglycan/LPS O-acetylase OafA/YrhL
MLTSSSHETADLVNASDDRGSADSRSTRYRPHIDGLRAVAVLSVIAYHMSAFSLRGGYLGVDSFFVISGFLITSVIWREARNMEFSILRFYERRIRRIMPALLLVLAVAAVLSTLVLLPVDLAGFARSLLASLGFSANIYFWRDTNYFTQLANERPLLHLWSLGVEEQFYILFPIMVVLFAKRRASILLPLLVFCASLSLIADVVAIRAGADIPAFYLLPTRAWEIGAGCIVALAPLKVPSGLFRVALEVLAGLFLIIGLVFNGPQLWRSVIPPALWVVAGTSLIIYFGEASASWLTRALSLQVLVGIGVMSYSLYLWHWPILVFARYYFVKEDFSLIGAVGLLILMLGCAVFSWRYVERPFRNRRMPIRSTLVWVASVATCLLIVAVVLIRNNGFPSRFNPSITKINAAVGSEFRCSLSETFPFGGYRACLIGTPAISTKNVTVALVGNSHAQMYAPLVSDILKKKKQGAILAHLNGCLPMPDLNISRSCLEEAAKNVEAVESLPHVRLIILGTTWNLTDSMISPSGAVRGAEVPLAFSASLDRLIDRFQHDGKAVVLIGPIAYPNYDSASVVGRQMAFGRPINEPLSRPVDEYLAEYGEVLTHFTSRRDITFIRPDRIQCVDGKCDFFRNGVPLFADSDHLAQVSLDIFRPAFESALLNSLQQ